MITLLMLLFTAQIIPPGTTTTQPYVCLDTVEFRSTVSLLEDREVLAEGESLYTEQIKTQKKQTQELSAAVEYERQASKLLHTNYKHADSARRACVVTASVIAQASERRGFWRGLAWGGIGSVLTATVAFVVGVVVGN